MKANDLIVMGGAPRSGTSLVQKMLGLHSEIYAGPEYDSLNKLIRFFSGLSHSSKAGRIDSYIDQHQLHQTMREVLDKVLMAPKIREGKRFLSEKSPQNVFEFEAMAELFEEAKFIFVIRDPRAVCASMKEVIQKMDSASKSSGRFGKGFEQDMKELRGYMRVGHSFFKSHPERCIRVQYEALVKHPEQVMREISSFIGVPYEESMIRTASSTDASSTLRDGDAWYSKDKYDRAIDTSSMDKWKTILNDVEQEQVALHFINEASCEGLGYDLSFKPRLGHYLSAIKKKMKG